MTDEIPLQPIKFSPFHSVVGRSSIADLFPAGHRCGIYILRFANGQYYCGQSIDVTRRFLDHRRNYPDITDLSFKSVPKPKLDQEEQLTIDFLEKHGMILRNILLITYPYGPSDFDTIMEAEDQERWLNDLSYVDLARDRLQDAIQRSKYHTRFHQFIQLSQSTEILLTLQKYITVGIPAIRRGEMVFWSCSCLPARSNDQSDFLRLNIYKQEVFTCRCFHINNSLVFYLHLSKSALKNSNRLLWLKYLYHDIFLTYPSGGKDQIRLHIHGLKHINKLLDDPRFIKAIRVFNMQLMKRGPSLNSRSHCLDMVDFL